MNWYFGTPKIRPASVASAYGDRLFVYIGDDGEHPLALAIDLCLEPLQKPNRM